MLKYLLLALMVIFLLTLEGKEACRFMLPPLIPTQHLAPPINDPGYLELAKKRDGAKTPWEKRRAEIAIERYGERYTGDVFGREKKELEEKTNRVIQSAADRLKKGELAEKVFRETSQQLNEMQERADRSWKGHGPEVLEPALEKLDDLYLDKNILIPGLPIKNYRLKEEIKNADLDYEMIKGIDSLIPPFPTGSKYQIGDLKYVKGKFRILKFIAEYPGRSALSEKAATFHDLLVLKIDGSGSIIDAFHYTLEWTDSPRLDLYRLGRKGLKLKPGLRTGRLKLRNVADGKRLRENGIVHP